MFERVRQMLIKEFIQVFRDPRMSRIIFVAPLIQLVVFGYAARTDVRHVAMAVHDLDNSAPSRELVSRFLRSGYFDTVGAVSSDAEARRLLDRGDAQAVLRLNRGFGEQVQAGRTAELQLLVDGTDSSSASIILNYGTRIARQFSQDILVQHLRRRRGGLGGPTALDLRLRAWFNEDLESRNFYVPGVIANISMLVTLMLTSMSVVREKEIGTMEQILVTPITPGEFIIGKTVPFGLIALLDTLLIMTVGVFWFQIPLRGSLGLLFVSALLFLMSTLGFGLLISTLCETQQQAMMSTFMTFFPAMMLSGFIFPIANMPALVRFATYLDPLRYFLVIIRGIFLKGVGAGVLWPQMLALLVLGLLSLYLASTRFRKTLA